MVIQMVLFCELWHERSICMGSAKNALYTHLNLQIKVESSDIPLVFSFHRLHNANNANSQQDIRAHPTATSMLFVPPFRWDTSELATLSSRAERAACRWDNTSFTRTNIQGTANHTNKIVSQSSASQTAMPLNQCCSCACPSSSRKPDEEAWQRRVPTHPELIEVGFQYDQHGSIWVLYGTVV